jgi:hypothetical protein
MMPPWSVGGNRWNAKSPTNLQESNHRFRRANVEDLDQVVELLFDLCGKVSTAYGMKADGNSLIETALHTIKYGVCLIGGGAVAGGMLVRMPYNREMLIGNVLFWNFTKPSGAAIFEAMVNELEKLGAKYISATSHFPDNRLGDFYCKRGLKAVETIWLAEISTMRHKNSNPKAEQ